MYGLKVVLWDFLGNSTASTPRHSSLSACLFGFGFSFIFCFVCWGVVCKCRAQKESVRKMKGISRHDVKSAETQ